MIWVLVSLVIVVLLAAAVIVSRDRFVRQRNLVQESWRQVDVELHRRYDLIPRLADVARPYSESGGAAGVDELDRLRAQAAEAAAATPTFGVDLAARATREAAVTAALRPVFELADGCPDLLASSSFADLRRQLAETEDRIAAGKRFYNANVRAYNHRVASLPSSVLAKHTGFAAAEYFEIDETDVRAASRTDLSTLR